MTIAILIPTLGRADVLPELLQNIRQVTPPCYRVYFVLDSGDTESWEVCRRLSGGGGDVVLVEGDGSYPVKTNRGYECTGDEDLILPTADDVVFHRGWYEAAARRFTPLGPCYVVGTLDLTPATARGLHATMPIIHRSYIEDWGAVYGEKGKVFHEGYAHNFCETETWQLARHRGVARFERESVIEHLHPAWGTREADATDRKGNARGWDVDKALFEKRKAEWTA
jgi:glycosyltransferase involved in cell wall biosynthesis